MHIVWYCMRFFFSFDCQLLRKCCIWSNCCITQIHGIQLVIEEFLETRKSRAPSVPKEVLAMMWKTVHWGNRGKSWLAKDTDWKVLEVAISSCELDFYPRPGFKTNCASSLREVVLRVRVYTCIMCLWFVKLPLNHCECFANGSAEMIHQDLVPFLSCWSFRTFGID